MTIIIDGYNLLHVTGIIGRGIGPGTLERSRGALLNFLAAAMPPDELARTTVVFDAKDAPAGRPRQETHHGIDVRYAADYEDADTMIEELIRKDSAPRQLTVVSSDHRIQRAARRRRATPVDSDVWYDQVLEQRQTQLGIDEPIEFKPDGPMSDEEVKWWLQQFGDVAHPEKFDQSPFRASETSDGRSPSHKEPASTDDLTNPFPSGYADDLLND